MTDLMIFEGHEVEVFEFDGQVLFNPYHVGKCLELGDSAIKMAVSKMNDKQVVKLTNSKVKKSDFRKLHNTGENFITESGVYKLVFKSHKPNAEKFTDWIADEVLPTIRKTGGYVSNEDLFISTYLPYADESTKLIFAQTLRTVREQNETIERQKNEIMHKEDVIIGLVDDISLAEKRQVLNRVVRYNHANYKERWALLYREFENKYHIDLQNRLDNYNTEHKPKCKGKLDYIDRVMGKIPELYEIAAKLFESDVKSLVEEMYQAVTA
jgi:prophage antirepressor-like protein